MGTILQASLHDIRKALREVQRKGSKTKLEAQV
jgi:hypothetical protein